MINLELASLTALSPVSQAPGAPTTVKPSITVINETEFLILSWTGASTIGIFVNSDGDPVRGTLEWPAHPQSVCMFPRTSQSCCIYSLNSKYNVIGLDYPYVTALLPNDTIEIHSLETQSIVQVLSTSTTSPPTTPSGQLPTRVNLAVSQSGYMVPSTERSDKMRLKPVPLLRSPEPVES